MIKNRFLLILCFSILLSSLVFISSQNETNETGINETNVSGICGDSIINQDLGEGCDNGTDNGVSCSASYGEVCNYCSTDCKIIEEKGAYCGDGICQEDIEDYLNCPHDNCKVPPKNECAFDSNCDDNNKCTDDKCQDGKCQHQNLDGKRIDNDKYYCSNGNLENQNEENIPCTENWECKSNVCTEGTCLRIKPSLAQRFFEFFGFGKLYDWFRSKGFL